MPPEGETFKPSEPYTHRLRRILEEYPVGSQVLREILQNSDDAKSTEQVFILDHNTYPSNSLLEPDIRTNLKLDRYQGPALLAKNDSIFEERDFDSLRKLANSEKRDQFDKIGGKFTFLLILSYSNFLYILINVDIIFKISDGTRF